MARIIKDNYYYYISRQHKMTRKRGFMYTGFNPFAKYNIDIYIVITDANYICFLNINNINIFSQPRIGTCQSFVDKIEQLITDNAQKLLEAFEKRLNILINLDKPTTYEINLNEWKSTHKTKGVKKDA